MTHFLELLRESEGAVNVTGDAVATNAKPLFTATRFGNRPEYVVPHDAYLKLRNGRERYSRWEGLVDDETLRESIRNSLYGEGACLITSDQTGSAVFLRHEKRVRQRFDSEAVGTS